ncbi:uncharacterized protein LOC108853232 isoform X1 [Raphanus sativus]|uniref:Uncharacterized protein LOC108853232 isoform X1 n=1 Tax=Raphanus sativus TaxID=3726 RepID=A0A9W3C0X8_RAPSA|nr:uncharacterized protein LOC108853232 isoform X1 [Raphanus sativus]XP_056845271.1 uncharacterized protein LOC108853232 isoform X1 [Raphanus sativus]
MYLNKSNPKAEAEEAETAKIDPSDLEQDVRDGSNWKGLEKLSSSEDETNKAMIFPLSVEDESNGEGITYFNMSKEAESNWEETEKEALVSLSEAAKKIVPSHFAAFIDEIKLVPQTDLLRVNVYLNKAFSQVSSLPWFNMLKKSPLSDVPFSHIPKSVFETAVECCINKLPFYTHWNFVMWALDRLLIDWAAHARGEEQPLTQYQVATLVELAMVLRASPDSLTCLLPMLRGRPMYHGQDKLPLIVWMMAQAFQSDLPAALYSWAHNLLPLVVNNDECYSSQSIDLILQFVEKILSSNPKARVLLLLNKNVRNGEVLIPPPSFETLVRLTFPPPSARVEGATERFEAIYPLLKEVALAPGSCALQHNIFTFSLKLAGGQGNPALANEATAIAISVLTQNVDCFTQWEILYKENLEASVLLLKKLVDEWKDHCLKLSPCSDDARTVKHAMYSFRMENEKAITEGVVNLSLYKEADKSCKLILRRLLSRGSGGLGIGSLTAMFIAAAGGIVGAALTLYISCK